MSRGTLIWGPSRQYQAVIGVIFRFYLQAQKEKTLFAVLPASKASVIVKTL